jgi:5-formyltetrahydrofolate cyclo-ligase
MSAVGPDSQPCPSVPSALRPVLSAKAALRQKLIAQVRDLAPVERQERAARASAHLVRFIEAQVPAGSVVALYAATATELTADPAIQALSARYRIAFPRVAGPALTFHESPLEALTAHQSRIREPLVSTPQVMPDAMVIPGRAFDVRGIRLGHGYGYYDRTLADLRKPCLLIGCCLDFQVVESLPSDPHDRWVHWLVTDGAPPRRCQNPNDPSLDPHDPAHAAGPQPPNTGAVDHRSGAS